METTGKTHTQRAYQNTSVVRQYIRKKAKKHKKHKRKHKLHSKKQRKNKARKHKLKVFKIKNGAHAMTVKYSTTPRMSKDGKLLLS